MKLCVFLLFILGGTQVLAQDPAQGWMGYATTQQAGTITYMEAKWKVGGTPPVGGAFFSPWFGIEASDNLNLIQPVNPWVGNSWQIYNEYFQWEPTHNYNSASDTVSPGDVLFGSVRFNPDNQSYTIYHSDLTTGWSVTSEIPVQKRQDGSFKNYNIVYIVYEKVWNCDQYPPEGKVTFYDIKLEYNNTQVQPVWKTSIVDDNCNNRAHVVDPATISITWDTSGKANPALKLSQDAADAQTLHPLH